MFPLWGKEVMVPELIKSTGMLHSFHHICTSHIQSEILLVSFHNTMQHTRMTIHKCRLGGKIFRHPPRRPR